MKIDAFIQLIKDLRQNQISDDTDPNNTVVQLFTSPFDIKSYDDSTRILITSNRVWGDGKTYTAYDSNNQAYQAPSCGWLWGAGGTWSAQSKPWTYYQASTWTSLGSNTWASM